MSLIAGFSRQFIIPDKPQELFGYPHTPRRSTGVHDPIFASTLYIFDGSQAVLFVALDLLMLATEYCSSLRRDIQAKTGIPAEHILISCTHTHSAPVTMDLLAFSGDPTIPPVDTGYLLQVHSAVVSACCAAKANAVPAQVAFAQVQVEGVGTNRHDPNGPRDPTASLMLLQTQDGRPLALSLVYAMHPTVMHEDSSLISADFIGYTRQNIETRFPGLQVIYHNGPCGNLSPRYHVSGQTFAEAERLGSRLGDFVSSALERLSPGDFLSDLPITVRQTTVDLPPRLFPSLLEAQINLQAARETLLALKKKNSPHGPTRTAEVSVFGAQEAVTLAAAQESGALAVVHNLYRQAEIIVIRFGPQAFVGLPGEVFVEYGLEIKSYGWQSFILPTTVISLANGELQGYIVTPDATGYEASFSLFKPETGSLMVKAVLALLT